MKDEDLSKNMSKFVDCKYSLGDRKEGWDCLSFIWDLYEPMGVTFLKEFKGITADNYGKIWKKGEARKEFEEYLLSLGRSVKKEEIRRGDLIIFKTPDGPAPAVFTGNGNVHLISEKGGKTLPLDILRKALKIEIIDIRRLI